MYNSFLLSCVFTLLSHGGLGDSPSRRRHLLSITPPPPPPPLPLQRGCLLQLKVFSAPLRAFAFIFTKLALIVYVMLKIISSIEIRSWKLEVSLLYEE
jgi:hypothetical protein